MDTSEVSQQSLYCMPERFQVGTQSTTTITMKLTTLAVGKFRTIINSIINECHSLPLTFKATVICPSLVFSSEDIMVNLKDTHLSAPLTLTNVLNVPVKYYWDIPEESCFTVKPISGEVSSKRSIESEIYYVLNTASNCGLYERLALHCMDGTKHSIRTIVQQDKLDICFQSKIIDAQNIPLNIEFNTKAVILNKGYEPVRFRVKNPHPLHGINITPVKGIIQKRSYQYLNINILLSVIISFSCFVEVTFLNTINLNFCIKGKVHYPKLAFKPSTIQFKRIVAESFDVQLFTLMNTGSTVIKLDYEEERTPEYRIRKCSAKSDSDNLTSFLLEPGEVLELALFYFPHDISMSKIYLPIIINDILGPPQKEYDRISFSKTYLKSVES